MSFQGDVSGPALADLLQSMARGREGVLRLNSRRTLRLNLGILAGALYLLPDEKEDVEGWRLRAEDAFPDPEATRVDPVRMAQIARASRIETMFALLEAGEVHFRFQSGPVPRGAPSEGGENSAEAGAPATQPAIYLPPMQVEGLLLEHARLADEGQGVPGWEGLQGCLMIEALAEPQSVPDKASFLGACDGRTTLREIADILGWPLRQARITAQSLLVNGQARLAERATLLPLVKQELERCKPSRAAARLTAWLSISTPGLIPPEDLEQLERLQSADLMHPLLVRMHPRDARRLALRAGNSSASTMARVSWHAELARLCPNDKLAGLHLLAVQVRSGIDPSVPRQEVVMELARAFHAAKQRLRARALLRVAATRESGEPRSQLELGRLLLENGAPMDAAPWIVSAAKHYLELKQPEPVQEVLRGLCEVHAGGADARRLLTRARALSVKYRLTRKSSLITMATVVILASSGVIQYRFSSERSRLMAEVREHMNVPQKALAAFEERFSGDNSGEIEALGLEIRTRLLEQENAQRNAWYEQYHKIQTECNLGDTLRGLQQALDLPKPPKLRETGKSWPSRSDLFRGLVARMERCTSNLRPALDIEPAERERERSDRELLRSMRTLLAGSPQAADIQIFDGQLQKLALQLDDREDRRVAHAKIEQETSLRTRQNILYNTARALNTEGRYAEALASFEELLPMMSGTSVYGLLEAERDALAARVRILENALRLCEAGEYGAAREELETDPKLRDQPMPMRVDSIPAGALLTLPSGLSYRCPVELRASLQQDLEFTLTLNGHEALTHKGPAQNLKLALDEQPVLRLDTRGRIEGAPLFHNGRTYIGDRSGVLRCLEGTERIWERETGSLSGFARTAAPNPSNPEQIFFASEDGEVWIVSTRDGKFEGPWRAPLPLRSGPEIYGAQIVIRLRDGSAFAFGNSLEPTELDPPPAYEAPRPLPSAVREAGGAYFWKSGGRERRLRRNGTLYFAIELGGWLYLSDGSGLRMWRP